MTIQMELGEDGRYLRVENFRLPGSEDLTFSRLFVKINEEEYELIRNFQCKFLCELRQAGKQPIFCCLATEHDEGKVETIKSEYLANCGMGIVCQHICQWKKDIARILIDKVQPGDRQQFSALLKQPTTIELKPKVLCFGL